MEFQKQNNFEEEWRKAFEGASVPPSDELWGRIESELDKKKKRSPFLFFLKPSFMATGLAAALALVLGSILFFNRETNTDVAQNPAKPAENKLNIPNTQSANTTKGVEAPTARQEAMASAEALPEVDNTTKETRIKISTQPALGNQESIVAINARKIENKNSGLPTVTQSTGIIDNTAIANKNPAETAPVEEAIPTLSAEALTESRATLASVENLDGKKYRYLGSRYTMNRNKLAFDAEALENTENTALASNDSKFWVGLQSGVAPFDPNMKFSNLNSLAYSSANEYAQLANGSAASPGDKNVQVSRPQNDIKAGLAINNGVAVGYKIAKKWHVESGVRYLRGNSTLQTNTYAFQNNGYVNTFLGDYLLQNSAKDYAFGGISNTVVADASQFNNRYEYLMVPMQVGYEIGLTKKLGLNILAGISTDIFLQNSIFTDNGLVRGKNTISNDSKIYKPVNFSGLGGLRASYLISKHWQANIGTSYQRALFSGMNSTVDLNMRLQMFGLNYGFNYRF
ncbi:hypothetical protein [Emticicia sp. C21]|uniref:hypothetical protein n=1 Tax=Emticicia sp. C21 TaxID=2302915 RepID=UPI000E34E8A6|nr:hypothetical protein [Emticicia sp. C21]RFS16096.1 hypothetical protein D0T08_14500 [Emticicia sp. C21]